MEMRGEITWLPFFRTETGKLFTEVSLFLNDIRSLHISLDSVCLKRKNFGIYPINKIKVQYYCYLFLPQDCVPLQ